MFRNVLINNFRGLNTFKKEFTPIPPTLNFVSRLSLLSILCLVAITTATYSHAESVPTYAPVINGEYAGTLYVYGVPVSILMSISSDVYGLGHKFTLTGAQQDLFIIGGNCDCLDSGAILAEHGLFSECLGIDMGLLDQVELEGWFTDEGYRGELKLFTAGSDISIPSLIGIFDLVRQ